MSPDSQPRALKQILDELREALDAQPDGDASADADLREVARAIAEHLDPDVDTDTTDDSVLERVKTAIEGFEGRHPTLTEVVGRIADTLADLGI